MNNQELCGGRFQEFSHRPVSLRMIMQIIIIKSVNNLCLSQLFYAFFNLSVSDALIPLSLTSL